MAKGWLKRPNGRNVTLFVWRDSTGDFRSRSLGPRNMTDDAAWQKVGEEGFHLLVGKPHMDAVLFRDLRQAFILDARTASGRPKAHSTLNTEKRNCRIHLSHFDRKPAKDITIISIDAVKGAFEAMIAGKLNVSVECSPLLGPQLMQAVKDLKAGKTLPRRIVTQEGVFPMEVAAKEFPSRKY